MDMPDEIYATGNYARFGTAVFLPAGIGGFDVRGCPRPEELAEFIVLACNSYSLHRNEIAKLRNALDVAEKALNKIACNDDFSQFSIEETDWVTVAKDAYDYASQALTTIKQARGE